MELDSVTDHYAKIQLEEDTPEEITELSAPNDLRWWALISRFLRATRRGSLQGHVGCNWLRDVPFLVSEKQAVLSENNPHGEATLALFEGNNSNRGDNHIGGSNQGTMANVSTQEIALLSPDTCKHMHVHNHHNFHVCDRLQFVSR